MSEAQGECLRAEKELGEAGPCTTDRVEGGINRVGGADCTNLRLAIVRALTRAVALSARGAIPQRVSLAFEPSGESQ